MATAAATAAGYSPLSGLITDNNYGSYVKAPSLGGSGGGLGVTFTNPDAPANPGAPGAPAGVAGSISGAGAYTPDWAALISGDAGFKDAAAALAAGGANTLAGRNTAITNAFETFGKPIDLAALASQLGMSQADLQNALTPDVQKLAQENTDAGLSTTSRLDQANQKATRDIVANLNKRGILHSGEAAYQLDQQNLGYRQAQADAYQKFLGYLQQYQQGYLAAQQKNSSDLAGAYSSAADRQYNLNHSSPGVTAAFDHVDANGNPVYKGPDGVLYNGDGSKWTAPAPPPGPAPDNFNLPTAGRVGMV